MDFKSDLAKDIFWPLVGLFLATSIFWFTDLDINLQQLFYQKGTGWYLKNSVFWEWVYEYGPYPGILTALGGLGVLVISFISKGVRKYRKLAAFLFLFMLLGSGLVVNVIFKNQWGRPRPREITQFGGDYEFIEPWALGDAGDNSSFPSGHASTVFYLMFPYFLLKDRNKNWAYFWLGVGIITGVISGTGRMIQGGHFASDVLWSGGFMYLTGISLYYLFNLKENLYLE